MTSVFFANLLLGFALAAEFGQVSVEIFKRGVRYGFKQAISVSLGGAFADFIYLNLAIAGAIFFLKPELLGYLWMLGGAVILYLSLSGLLSFFSFKKELVGEAENESAKFGPFAVGFALNLLHPLNLIWWITILSPALIYNAQQHSRLTAYFDGMGIVVGVFLWWILLSLFSSFLKERVKVGHLRWVFGFSSLALLGFGVWFFYNAYVIFTG